MKTIRCVVGATALSLVTLSASAEFLKCEKLTPDQETQAEFCSAHVGCRIAIKLMKTCSDLTEFYSSFFNEAKGKSQEELARQPDPERDTPQPVISGNSDRFGSANEIEFRKNIVRNFQREDQELASKMRNLNCGKSRRIDEQECSDIGVQALSLQRSVAMHNRLVRPVRSPLAPDFLVPALQTQGMVSQDGGNFIVFASTTADKDKPSELDKLRLADEASNGSPQGPEPKALTDEKLPRRESGYGNRLFGETLDKVARGESIVQPRFERRTVDEKSNNAGNDAFLEIMSVVAQGVLQYKLGQIGQQNALLAQQQAAAVANATMRQQANAARARSDKSASSNNDQVSVNQASASKKSSSSDGPGTCDQKVQELDHELGQRISSIPPNDNVRRLALSSSYASKMSVAMQPCSADEAKSYANTAASAMSACRQIASSASFCNP